MKRNSQKWRGEGGSASFDDDVHETLHAVRLVGDLLDHAMGFSAAKRVLKDPSLRASFDRAGDALEDLYQQLGRVLARSSVRRSTKRRARRSTGLPS